MGIDTTWTMGNTDLESIPYFLFLDHLVTWLVATQIFLGGTYPWGFMIQFDGCICFTHPSWAMGFASPTSQVVLPGFLAKQKNATAPYIDTFEC